MASVTCFIPDTLLASQSDYFMATVIEFPAPVNWEAPESEVVRPLLQAVNQMDDNASGGVFKGSAYGQYPNTQRHGKS